MTFLCVMAATKGLYAQPFLRRLKARGHRVLVVTRAAALELPWPREWIDGLYGVEALFDPGQLRDAVSYLARSERIDRIVGPGEFDVELAAALREHFRLDGLSLSQSYLFRDKLAMRTRIAQHGLPQPEFAGAFHHSELAQFMAATPGPWLLKPRTEASSQGIQKVESPQALGPMLEELGDRQSHHLLESFIPGDVYHVDSLVHAGEVRFAQAHRYGTPILELHSRGGIYTTLTVEHGTPDDRELLALNCQVLQTLGLQQGVTHVEYLRAPEGPFLFLEASARVGAGMIEDLVEATSGLNLWAEWADLEAATPEDPYAMPPVTQRHGGLAICMTPFERPDLSPLQMESVLPSVPKPYHAAALVANDSLDRVEGLMAECVRRIDHAYREAPFR